MSEATDYDVAVIGAGGAGTMAYLRAVLNCNRTALFQGDADTRRRGRATWVAEVDNIPGMHGIKSPITASARTTQKWVESQPQLADYSHVLAGKVTRIEPLATGFRLHYSHKKAETSLVSRFVILATGVMDVQPLIQGAIEPVFPFANRGHLLYCLRCDGHRTIGKKLAVIAHEEQGLHLARILSERYHHARVDILTHGREPVYSEAGRQLAEACNFQIHTGEIISLLGDAKTGLTGFALADGSQVESDCAMVALGTIVYNDLLAELGAELADDGRVITSESFESSIPGIFAVGDLVAGGRMQVYTAWDEAVTAAEAIDRRLREARRKA
ncbi:MAG TPA: NAD(P)/FAD-dependent oxidoreductase [Candidatus Obscuribacterales bacterium]